MNTDASFPTAGPAAGDTSRTWERWLLWSGAPLCAAGLAGSGIGAQWRGGRFVELLVLAIASLALAGLLRRLLRWQLATGLAVSWILAMAWQGGMAPALATALFAAAALAGGGLVARGAPAALQLACGLAVIAGVLGWLLPVPVHHRVVYLAACAALVAARWRVLVEAARLGTAAWSDAVAAAPRAAAFAVLLLGLASTGAWLPTMQADDLTYHLRLPWQLATEHHYPLRPGLHIWSMAPWAADVLQAAPQVMAGAEARGSFNVVWIALIAVTMWRIARALGGAPRAAWLAVALAASLPLTAALAGGMQTELPTAALLAWLVAVLVDIRHGASRWQLWAAAALVGGLAALKLAAAALALVFVPWAAWRLRGTGTLPRYTAAVLLAAAVAGSSYAYAGIVAGNPFLPLFNDWFGSPHYATAGFDDPRWHAGFDAMLPWNLTFHTDRYLEAFAGGGGFILVALAGPWLLALRERPTRMLAITATAALALVLLPMQYLRYAYPVLVVIVPALVVAAFRVDARAAVRLLIAVCVLNLAFQANAFWLLRVGMVKMSILEAGRDAALFRAHVPERNLVAAMRDSARGNVLAFDSTRPYVAELGLRGRSVSQYDRSMHAAALAAEANADGSAWVALLRREGITDVLVWPARQTAAQRAALARMGATRAGTEAGAEWWRVPAEGAR